MSDNSWRDALAAERMRVDREFEEQVQSSSFTRQQWGLVMTAVEFDIDGPSEPETAQLVADTSKLPSVMPQIEQMEQSGGGMGAPAGGAGGSGGSGGGLLGKLASILPGGDSSGGGKRQDEAASLAQEYAEALQQRLEKRDRWQAICEQASAE